MLNHLQNTVLDDIDKALLRELQADGRLTNVELARRVSLSPPATLTRLKRLEKDGFIRNYAAIVDREKAGYDLLCFIHIAMQMHQQEQIENFRRLVQDMPEVLECHHITGEYDYLLKVVFRSRKDLERFAVNRLTPIPGVSRIHTSLVFTEVKSITALPLE
ncbi:MAG: Lrp/AsnC family transcriptional regulator [Anaerolineales bacterium]|jgi:Lrp/AsnC family leucine-responsive transcriptional regulator|nr:Lrp/AsnC family transcriptional regulator [Chloroflexota bacterium]MBK6644572.1 Lrp/AsnC family transcriptional regulator [Anaerolineales bacterium]